MNTDINFEEWAKLLINRKVPNDCSHLIDSDVVHTGADILKRGDAFEVHLIGDRSSSDTQILVKPLPHFA
jgi:hypothetical protein